MKEAVRGLLRDLAGGADAASVWHDDARIEATHPWGALDRAGAGVLWAQLRASLPDLERRDLLAVASANRDDPRLTGPRAPHLVALLSHLHGTFAAPLRGIPATGGAVVLRVAEAHWLDGARIRHSWTMIDLLDLMRQARVWPLPRSYGAEGAWPGPPDEGRGFHGDALATVLAMHDALHAFDGRDTASMRQEAFWAPGFLYHGGAGIGTCRGLAGFRRHHQEPFLRAFPDRRSEGHFVRVAEGRFAVTGGTVLGTHRGEWLGLTATGRALRIPVMDFYRLDERGRIAENWLPIDVLGAAAQMGADLLARAAHYAGAPPEALDAGGRAA
jgi:predicted ester cyclase